MSKERNIIVTGGGSGIGLGIAEKFVKAGDRAIIIGRSVKKLENAREKLGPLCETISFDLNHLEGIPRLVNDIVQKYGRIDALINNAGINRKNELLNVTDEEFREVIHTNLFSLFALSREAAKIMVDQKKGAIIHISSMTAHYGLPKVVAYSASKTAVEGLTRAMAVELSPLGIRVNAIAPGFIITDMTAKAFQDDPARKERVLQRTPAGKMGSPSDIAQAAYFLASDKASFITGEVLKVDGGNSVGF